MEKYESQALYITFIIAITLFQHTRSSSLVDSKLRPVGAECLLEDFCVTLW